MTRMPTLSRKKDFQKIFQEGRSLVNRELVLYFLANQNAVNKVAFCVGKNMGSAVQRNRVRRRMREAFRTIEKNVSPGYDLAWVARTGLKNISFPQICREMNDLLSKARLFSDVTEKKEE